MLFWKRKRIVERKNNLKVYTPAVHQELWAKVLTEDKTTVDNSLKKVLHFLTNFSFHDHLREIRSSESIQVRFQASKFRSNVTLHNIFIDAATHVIFRCEALRWANCLQTHKAQDPNNNKVEDHF